MRIDVADCTVQYEGRLNAYLPPATRLVMVKADGCVAVHADGGAYKPLNWKNAPNDFIEEEGRWIGDAMGKTVCVVKAAAKIRNVQAPPNQMQDVLRKCLHHCLRQYKGAIFSFLNFHKSRQVKGHS